MKRIALAAILIFTVASGIDDGGSVHPTYYERTGGFHNSTLLPNRTGISLRDYFAASYLGSTNISQANRAQLEYHVDMAYTIADAMIQRRKR